MEEFQEIRNHRKEKHQQKFAEVKLSAKMNVKTFD